MTLPPVTRLFGLSPSQEAKWPVLSHLVMSVPISLNLQGRVRVHAVRGPPPHLIQVGPDIEAGAFP